MKGIVISILVAAFLLLAIYHLAMFAVSDFMGGPGTWEVWQTKPWRPFARAAFGITMIGLLGEGLLAIQDSSDTYYASYDGNGNVTALVDASDGSVTAVYEHDPFGNSPRPSRAAMLLFALRFFDVLSALLLGNLLHRKRKGLLCLCHDWFC